MPSPLTVVMIANVLPHDGIPHAGGQYVHRLVREVESFADLTVIVPNNPTSRAAAELPGTPSSFVVAGSTRAATLPGRAASRLATVVDLQGRRLDPGLTSVPLALNLLRDRSIREAIARSDVIDLQWSECIRLAPLVRRINPRARIVGTFHDIQSQLFERESAVTGAHPGYWRAVARHSRRLERRLLEQLDEVLVFSDKDADLLGRPARGRVVRPPLAPASAPLHRPGGASPTVLFVSHLARPENDQGALWLLDKVWPQVVQARPDARLRLVGAGASGDLTQAVAQADSVELAGFVPHLDEEYAAATACVVPLHIGAGVKFKTVEALTHGVPVLTTRVGAEGIGGADRFALLSDDPGEWVDALTAILTDPGATQREADVTQQWASAAYGQETFAEAIRASYAH